MAPAPQRWERDQALAKSVKGAIGGQQIDQERSAVTEAAARVQASQASLEVLKLKLDFCTVISPIDGQVGRYQLTVGNPGQQGQNRADHGGVAGSNVCLF